MSKGLSGNHCELKTMRMKLYANNYAGNDEENMSVFNPHFVQEFNDHKEIDIEMLDKLKKHKTLYDLDKTINRDEFDSPVTSLTNYKSPGLNQVSPEACKT